MQFFAFLTTFSLVDAPCVQMMTLKFNKNLNHEVAGEHCIPIAIVVLSHLHRFLTRSGS